MAEDVSHRRRRSPARRWLVVTAGLLAAATLLALVPLALRRIEEEMCLRRLDGPQGTERDAAIRRLGELRSVRAVPRLVEIAMGEAALKVREVEAEPAAQALVAIGPAAVEPLLDRWRPDYSRESVKASDILSKLGPESLQPFLKASRHVDEHRRDFAVRRLGDMVIADARAFDALVRALGDPWEVVRLRAVTGLTEARHRPAEALRHLLPRLDDPTEAANVRYWAAFDLPELGDTAISALRERLAHREELVRAYAAYTLLYHAPPLKAQCVRVLEACLDARDPRARHQAIDSLDRARALGTERLARFLADPDAEVRSAAVYRLDERRAAPEAIPELLRILREQPQDRDLAANLLGRLGPGAREAVPDLLQALEDDPSPQNRQALVQALGRIGPAAKAAVLALTGALATECAVAAEALGRIGADALVAAPKLVAAFADQDCQDAAVAALARIGPGVVPAVLPVLSSENADEHAKRCAVRTLERLGPGAAAATEALAAQLAADPGSPVELEALRALGRIGPAARAVIPRLVQAFEAGLKREWYDKAWLAADALGRMGPAAIGAAPLLRREAVKGNVPQHALLALGRIGASDPESVAAMREGLRSEVDGLRLYAALGLLHLPGQEVEARRVLAQIPAAVLPENDLMLFEALQGHPLETEALLPQILSFLAVDGCCLREACALLAELGPPGASALPRLESILAVLLQDPARHGPALLETVEETIRRLREAEN